MVNSGERVELRSKEGRQSGGGGWKYSVPHCAWWSREPWASSVPLVFELYGQALHGTLHVGSVSQLKNSLPT